MKMEFFSLLVLSLVGVLSTGSFLGGNQKDIAHQQANITAGLGPRLSSNTSILFPGSAAFTNATLRWQQYRSPDIIVAVEVATENDVQQTILYANQYEIPFLAKAGGHGAINSLGNVHNGIEIWMRLMNHISISEDGETAIIGGGAMVKEVTEALWAAGKQTVTGLCECVGTVSPMLGGGHGVLQGQHGLLADQLIEARIILANGSAVTVSLTSHTDLFWAIRGAGHNFGIVTEYKYRVYDVAPNSTWAYEAFTFTGNKLETLYSLTNAMIKTQPAEVVNFASIPLAPAPAIDPVDPIIVYYVLYDGPISAEREFSAQIHDLGPASVEAGEVPYPQLAKMTGNGDDDLACQPGAVAMRFPIDLKSYNTTALRLAYNTFSEMMQRIPAFNDSFFLLEGYSVEAVQAVPANETAFPDRNDTLLISPVIYYQPNSSLDATAVEYGKSIREILKAGSGSDEMHSYVNYAHGDESLQAMYGYEPWRLEKLWRLKKAYDPKGRFNFYAPIANASRIG